MQGLTDAVQQGRRRLLLAVPLAACALAMPLPILGAPSSGSLLGTSRALMGTRIDITLLGRDRAVLSAAADAAWAEMARLVAMMSRFRPTSALNAINLAAGLQPIVVPPELMQVLQLAQHRSRVTDGAFDATVGALRDWHFDPARPQIATAEQIAAQLPLVDYRGLQLDPLAGTAYLARRGMRLDLGGIAKLPILQAGMRVLRAHGVDNAMINGGGDVLVNGANAGRPWRIGLRDPRQRGSMLGTLDMNRGVVASSGDYERYVWHDGRRLHHVLDPATGRPTDGVRGVALVSDSVEAVNGLGPASMVVGSAAAQQRIAVAGDIDALIVDGENRLWLSPGMRQRLLAS
jgi:FAD:protein FMN transferase